MTKTTRDALLAARGVALGPLLCLLVYLVVLYGFEAATEDDGLLKPGGTPDLRVAALGLLVIALRLFMVFVLPPILAYRIASRAIQALDARGPKRGRDSPTG